ncbi:MAG: hypothetical protein KME27_23165 [Lyngbya sp. HA4199-MV5]|jgi:hypothetical protein|nr:hypothetical protein [Lyngbya sp. HA4199-MV5]
MVRNFDSPEDREHWEQLAQAKLVNLEEKALSSSNRYYAMKPAIALRVIDAKLSPTTYRLWLYLCTLFPFSGINEMPTQEELAVRLELAAAPSSVQRQSLKMQSYGCLRSNAGKGKI